MGMPDSDITKLMELAPKDLVSLLMQLEQEDRLEILQEMKETYPETAEVVDRCISLDKAMFGGD